MIYRRLLIVFAIAAFSKPSARGLAQTWSDTIRFEATRGIEFRWRDFFIRSDTVAHFFEWEFVNTTDSSATFEYLIKSDWEEERVGRITLKPRKKKLAGWYLTGNKIVGVALRKVIFGNESNEAALGSGATKRK